MNCVCALLLCLAFFDVTAGARLRQPVNSSVAVAKVVKPADSVATVLAHANSTANSSMKTYPCGKASKITAFSSYRANLLEKVCGMDTAKGFSCKSNLECMLNEFYTADCAGLSGKPDTCKTCSSTQAMSAGGFAFEGGFCYDFRMFYQKNYADIALYQTIMADPAFLGKELCCASMIMAQDGCASGTTQPSCF